MELSYCLLVSVGGRRSQHLESSTTLESLGPSHQRRHKSRVSLQSPFCAHGISGTLYEEVRDTQPHQTESMPTSTILVVGTSILKLPSSMVQHFGYLRVPLLIWHSLKGIVPTWFISNLGSLFHGGNLH